VKPFTIAPKRLESIVDAEGINGITRQGLLDELNQVKEFDANGMIGTVNVGDRIPSPCFVLTQVEDGEFVRVTPTKKGTFNCAKKNLQEVKLDLLTG
jgi:hypothetical protein